MIDALLSDAALNDVSVDIVRAIALRHRYVLYRMSICEIWRRDEEYTTATIIMRCGIVAGDAGQSLAYLCAKHRRPAASLRGA